jgi:hypothetical protein
VGRWAWNRWGARLGGWSKGHPAWAAGLSVLTFSILVGLGITQVLTSRHSNVSVTETRPISPRPTPAVAAPPVAASKPPATGTNTATRTGRASRPVQKKSAAPQPEKQSPVDASAPVAPMYHETFTFQNSTVTGGEGGAVLDCDPFATFNGLVARSNSTTQPTVDVGSSRCENRESFDELAAFKKLQSDVARDAGNATAVKADFESPKAKLRELRAPRYAAESRPAGYWDKLDQQLDEKEAAFLAAAEDRQKTLLLLSTLTISPR